MQKYAADPQIINTMYNKEEFHMAFCQNCGALLSEGAMFCGTCGARQETQHQKRICQNCGNELAEGMVFCDKCGTKYAAPASSQPASPFVHTSVSTSTRYHGNHSQSVPAGGYSKAPFANTGTLNILSIICIFLCWPVAIYGFVCQSRAKKAVTQAEADAAVHRGTIVCGIAIGIMAVLIVIVMITGL